MTKTVVLLLAAALCSFGQTTTPRTGQPKPPMKNAAEAPVAKVNRLMEALAAREGRDESAAIIDQITAMGAAAEAPILALLEKSHAQNRELRNEYQAALER